jgi:hypothetical protein
VLPRTGPQEDLAVSDHVGVHIHTDPALLIHEALEGAVLQAPGPVDGDPEQVGDGATRRLAVTLSEGTSQ